MRLGSSVKYTHTKEEMVKALQSIEGFSHLHSTAETILDSPYMTSKIYWEHLDGDVITPPRYCNINAAVEWKEIEYFWPSNCLEVLVYQYGIECIECKIIFNKGDDNKERYQWHEMVNKDYIKGRTKYYQEFQFGHIQYCDSCSQLIIDSALNLQAQGYLGKDNFLNIPNKEIIKIKKEIDELLALEESIKTIQKEIRNKKTG